MEQILERILVIRAIIIGLYKKFDRIINPIGKFIISLIIVTKLNKFFAYSPLFASLSINMAMAALAAFLPSSWFVLLLMAVVTLQLFSVSIEATIIVLLTMLVIYLLFGRIQPKYAMLILLVPLFFSWNIPYVLPVFAGLFLGVSSIIPLGVGVGVYYFAAYLPGLLELHVPNATLFESPDILIEMYKYLAKAMMADRNMILSVGVFCGVVIVMYFIRKFEIDYIHYITIGIGVIAMVMITIVGNPILKAGLSVGGVLLGGLLAGIIVSAMQFAKFSLDYKRSEKLQFEDDEYVYYVRTIPKIKASVQQNQSK